MDAFDSDVLIYAAVGHSLGAPVRRLLEGAVTPGVGSALLLPELLSKPLRDGRRGEVRALQALLSRLDLRPVDGETALVATALGAAYGLRAADATHLATAVVAGADRFITNNRSDFSPRISEVRIAYPVDLLDQPGD